MGPANWRRALAGRGLDPSGRIIEGDFSEAAGAAAVRSLLASGLCFDGVVSASDDMAFGGLQALKAAGRDVPGRVAVAGFGDFGLARLTTPAITTVRVPAEAMARLATQRLSELVDGSAVTPGRRHLPVTLTLRQSCGCR